MVLQFIGGIFVFIGFLTKVSIGQDTELYRCPSGLPRDNYLKTFNGKCYQYSIIELAWSDANGLCEDYHGHLIEIRDQATQDWVNRTLHELNWPYNGVWIGAHDRDQNGAWTWVTGDAFTSNTYTNWASGHPQCCKDYCGTLRKVDRGKWHSKLCGHFLYMYSYICQYAMGPATTTTLPPTTTTLPPTTTEMSTTEELTSTTEAMTSTETSTITSRSTSTLSTQQSTTTTPAPSSTSTVTTTTASSNQSNVGAVKKDEMTTAALSGVVVACVIGALVLLLFIGVCFYKRRKKKKGGDGVIVYFDNLAYSIRAVMSSKSRMRGHEQNLNNQVRLSNRYSNEYADINEYDVNTLPSNTKEKEQNHYSEIDDKLTVNLPKACSDQYQKCNIAKSKLGYNDKVQYLDEYESHKGNIENTQYLDAYESKQENIDKTQYFDAYDSKLSNSDTTPYLDACDNNAFDAAPEDLCNSMNEQLEAYKNRYDEYGNSERGDHLPNHYVDVDDTRTVNGQTLENFERALNFTKTVNGYPNNTYSTNA